MTEQEAINLLRFAFPEEITKPATEEVISKSVKSLEKQIPKKVVFIHPLQEDDGGDYMCPSCKSGTVYDAYGNKPPYCHYCGQALDWQ